MKAVVPNSGVFVFPRMTKPAAFSLVMWARSKSGTFDANACDGERRLDSGGRFEVLERDRDAVEGRLRRLAAFACASARASSPRTVT